MMQPPDPQFAISQRLDVLSDLGRWNALETEARAALGMNPRDSHAMAHLVASLINQGKKPQALEASAELIALAPTHPHYLQLRARALMDVGQLRPAEAACIESLRLDPMGAAAFRTLSLVQQKLGRAREALDSADRAVSLAPDRWESHARRAGVLLEMRRDRESVDATAAALSIAPESSLAHWLMATALVRLRDYKGAVTHYLQALRIDPANTEAQNELRNAIAQQSLFYRLVARNWNYNRRVTWVRRLVLAVWLWFLGFSVAAAGGPPAVAIWTVIIVPVFALTFTRWPSDRLMQKHIMHVIRAGHTDFPTEPTR